MTRRKIMGAALALSMAAILAVGGTLAYFMDTDSKTNVFTVGKVDITLVEDFDQNSKLIPATGSAQDGSLQNGVKKIVNVTNEDGSEPAYVRVHIAIPQVLDDGAKTFDASANLLHFNFPAASVEAGLWDWSAEYDDGVSTGNWNYYEEKIGDIVYNVYVVTYTSVLAAGATTTQPAMNQVYLDSEVTNGDIETLVAALGNNWEIKVVAEGAQAAGFDNAYDALNTAFGEPKDHKFTWPTATTTE